VREGVRAVCAAPVVRALLLACAWLLHGPTAQASALGYCNPPQAMNAAEHDRMLQFAAVIKSTLQDTPGPAVLIARSGLDLSRFGYRYSHAGVSLRQGQQTAWSVRQLYYDCDAHRPRLFDQGLSAFVLGTDDPALGYVSVVLLPPDAAAAIERTALDNPRSLDLLGDTYSANAYPFSTRYQNCNQWVMELMASAWGGLDGGPAAREEAQAWLAVQGYRPSLFEVGSRPLMWLGNVLKWVHSDDHPASELDRLRYSVSMPASVEAFAHDEQPGAERIEFCHTQDHILIHRGWTPIPEGCLASAGDLYLGLD
jgi:hypothetical protein